MNSPTSPRRACSRRRATSTGSPTACSRRCTSTSGQARLLPQADELPVPHPHLPTRGRGHAATATASLRVRLGVPRREVGGRARPHARARHDAGRRAHLLHQGADGGELASTLDFVLDLLRDYGLNDFYLELSTKPRARPWAPTRSGRRRPRRCAGRPRATGLGLVHGRGRRRVLRTEDLGAPRDAIGRTWQMSTMQLDFQPAGTLRHRLLGADNERHRPMMIHRTLFGSIERFFGCSSSATPALSRVALRRCRSRCSPSRDRRDAYTAGRSSAIESTAAGVPRRDARRRLRARSTARIRRAKSPEKVPHVLRGRGIPTSEHGTVGVNARGSDHAERDVPVAEFRPPAWRLKSPSTRQPRRGR